MDFSRFLKEETTLTNSEYEHKGILFKTGIPVMFPFIRKIGKSGNFGSQFQQDIEPHGTYLTYNSSGLSEEEANRIEATTGTIKFENPLVIPFNSIPQGGYDENSWKSNLVKETKKKGRMLSKYLLKKGHDGIITIDHESNNKIYGTSEIVSLKNFK